MAVKVKHDGGDVTHARGWNHQKILRKASISHSLNIYYKYIIINR